MMETKRTLDGEDKEVLILSGDRDEQAGHERSRRQSDTKRKVIGGTVAAIAVFCAVLAFNFGVFPRVLATPPGDSEIRTVTAAAVAEEAGGDGAGGNDTGANEVPDEAAPAAGTDDPASGGADSDPDAGGFLDEVKLKLLDSNGMDVERMYRDAPDVNAISKEQAIESAIEGMEDALEKIKAQSPSAIEEAKINGTIVYRAANASSAYAFSLMDYRTAQADAIYVQGTEPAGDANWIVVFKQDVKGYDWDYLSGLDKESREKYESQKDFEIVTDDEKRKIIRVPNNYTAIVIAEVNAYTGEYIERAEIATASIGDALNSDELSKQIKLMISGSAPDPAAG
jgi:hypothetical protein